MKTKIERKKYIVPKLQVYELKQQPQLLAEIWTNNDMTKREIIN